MPNNEHPCNLRHPRRSKTPSVKAVNHSTERVCFLGIKIWEILPDSFKSMESVEPFKKVIKI